MVTDDSSNDRSERELGDREEVTKEMKELSEGIGRNESDEEVERREPDVEVKGKESGEKIEGKRSDKEAVVEKSSDIEEVKTNGKNMNETLKEQVDNKVNAEGKKIDEMEKEKIGNESGAEEEADKRSKRKDRKGKTSKKLETNTEKKGEEEQKLKEDEEESKKKSKEEFELNRKKRESNLVICQHRQLPQDKNDKTNEKSKTVKIENLPEISSTEEDASSMTVKDETMQTQSTGDTLPSEITGSSVPPPSFMPPPPSFTPPPPSTSAKSGSQEYQLMKPPFDELPLPPEDLISVSELTDRTSPFCKVLVNFGKANAPKHFQAREDLLNLRNGDILVVTGKVNDDWYQGQLGDQLGLFPICLSTDVDENEVKRFIAQSMQKKKHIVSKESRQELQQKKKELIAAVEDGDKRIQDINEEIKELAAEAHRRRKKLRAKLFSEYNGVLPSFYYDIPLQEYIFHVALDILLTILEIKDMNDDFKNVLAAFVEASTDFAQEFKKHLAIDPRTKGDIEKAMQCSQQVQKCLMDELSNVPTELLNQCIGKLSVLCIQFRRIFLLPDSVSTSSRAEDS